MKLATVRIKNFRGYTDSQIIEIDSVTAFVGKNDVGKSTILEALDIFFHDGKGVVPIDKDDVNVNARSAGINEFSITCAFSELPTSVIVDSSFQTTLSEEYLTNAEGMLEVEKIFAGSKLSKVYLHAFHPSHSFCADLILKKNKDLKKLISDIGIACENQAVNAMMRKAIRDHFASELCCQNSLIDVSKSDDIKEIWGKLQEILPIYSLFQSDRENCDSDDEVQNPIKTRAREILSADHLQQKLGQIAREVLEALGEVVNRTYEKLAEMAPDVAAGLIPKVPSVQDLKWADVFKGVSISDVDNIPINKRGSGVKRLILLNFFRAEAERSQGAGRGIIYAIEEPETSQHSAHQALLVQSLVALAQHPGVQILLTTHSPIIVKGLGYDCLRLVRSEAQGRTVGSVSGRVLKYDSLIEAAYIAFDEITVEYHDELWAAIDGEKKLQLYKSGRPQLAYLRSDKVDAQGHPKSEPRILSQYIRDQIHHPENKLNPRFTNAQLAQSILDMRVFLAANP